MTSSNFPRTCFSKSPPLTRSYQNGLSLIEALIALLVLSIGLAGLAGLHLNSITAVHSSYLRSVASTAALDFEERTWLQAAETNGCPTITPGSLGEAHWDAANTDGFIGLPGLEVAIANIVTGTRIWEGTITITWDETRFARRVSADQVGEVGEAFVYRFGVYCSLP
jgi:type IV pilus assembly protein PilV